MTLLPNAKTQHLKAGSATVTYHDNQAHAPAVLLVHGTGGDMERHFGRLIPMLASKYRVVGLDLGNPPPEEPLELEHYVAQVVAVVDEAGLASAELTVVGYSLGAVIAAAFAAQHPEAVDRLVLLNGWVATDAYQRLRNAVWRELYDSGSEALARFSVFTAHSARFLNARTQAEIDQLVLDATADESRARQMELNARVDISRSLAGISCPTLVIAGDDDVIVPPSHGYRLLGAIDQARFASLPSGHAALTERPAQVFSLIDQFARGQMPGEVGKVYVHPTV